MTKDIRMRLLFSCCLAVLSIVAVVASGCGGKTSGSTVVTTGAAATAKPVFLEFKVGEQATVGDIRILVPVSTLTSTPARPLYPMSDVAEVKLGQGQTYYQAVVRVENAGTGTCQVDPRDFSAMVGRTRAAMDPIRSGPAARTLLHGTSLELILTFVVPEGAQPDLVYHPPWLNGTLVFKGQQKPVGAL